MRGATPLMVGVVLCVLLVVGAVAWQEWLSPHLFEIRRKRRYFATYRAQLQSEAASASDEHPPAAA